MSSSSTELYLYLQRWLFLCPVLTHILYLIGSRPCEGASTDTLTQATLPVAVVHACWVLAQVGYITLKPAMAAG